MFEVGQEVVCLGIEWDKVDPRCRPLGYFCSNWPTKGQHYHIRSVKNWDHAGWCVHLTEVINPKRDFEQEFGEPWFLARWFAPIEKKQYSIEVFTALLNPANHKVTEDA